jgi:PBP1b-binding outer membrane lipoprotein LpoB
MKKLICILASAALLGACEQKTEVTPAAPVDTKKAETNTTIVNPPASTEKKETTNTIVAPANTDRKTETTTTTTSSPNP